MLLSGSQIVFLFVAPWPRHEAPPMLGTALATAAATLAVISLLVHVYRNAHGIPEHRERYESCFSRLVALRAAFDSAQSMSAKRALMEEVEVMLVEELRAFMRQMREASFLL